MDITQRHPNPPRALRPLALGGAMLWGVLELVALWRARWPKPPGRG